MMYMRKYQYLQLQKTETMKKLTYLLIANTQKKSQQVSKQTLHRKKQTIDEILLSLCKHAT